MQKGKENLAMGAASSYEENTRRKKAFGRSRDVLSFLRETPKTMIFLPYKYPFSFFDDSDAISRAIIQLLFTITTISLISLISMALI